MAISFIDVHEAATDPTGTTWTINKPTNAATDDIMICTATFADDLVSIDPTFPTGWTQLHHLESTGGNDSHCLVGWRKLAAGDPSSWTGGSHEGANTDVIAVATAAYRGVDTTNPILGSIGLAGVVATTVDSGNVNNTDANAWAVGCSGSHRTATGPITVGATSDAQTGRGSGVELESGDWGYSRIYDSNGPVATGNRHHVTENSTTSSGLYATVVILKPAAAVSSVPLSAIPIVVNMAALELPLAG